MGRTAIFSVIFPANLPFFRSFLNSLVQQTDGEFDLLLMVDGVSNLDHHLTDFRNQLTIVTRAAFGNIAQIRSQGIAWLLSQDYENLIFSDSDDMLRADRVEVCKKHLSNFPVVVNDVAPFSEYTDSIKSEGYWRSRMSDGHSFSATSLRNYNFVGLGNTAVRKEVLTNIVIPDEIKVVDWFLFYHWMQHNCGVFVHDGCVLYRQHQSLAGVGSIDETKLNNIVNVKMLHYRSLINTFPDFRDHLKQIEQLAARLQTDRDFMKAAVQHLNENHINYFWWEETEYIHE